MDARLHNACVIEKSRLNGSFGHRAACSDSQPRRVHVSPRSRVHQDLAQVIIIDNTTFIVECRERDRPAREEKPTSPACRMRPKRRLLAGENKGRNKRRRRIDARYSSDKRSERKRGKFDADDAAGESRFSSDRRKNHGLPAPSSAGEAIKSYCPGMCRVYATRGTTRAQQQTTTRSTSQKSRETRMRARARSLTWPIYLGDACTRA